MSVVTRGDTFARLLARVPSDGADVEPDKVELSADWRAHPPVTLEITDAAFDDYGTSPEDIRALRRRFAQWRDELLDT